MRDAVKIAVLISGYGSNLQAIIDAVETGRLPGTVIACVVSDRAEAFGLQRAKRHGLPAIHFPYPPRAAGQAARQARDAELADLLERHGVQWVVLAGWLRVLSAQFLQRFPNRVVNLHPALPGRFPGLNAIERAFQAYHAARQADFPGETGVMVHLVPDEAVDAGPVVAVEPVPIYPDDTLESLTNRVHQVEHRLLIDALSKLLAEHPQPATQVGKV